MSPFADIDSAKPHQPRKEFKKTEYISLKEGQHVIRILDTNATKFYTHFVGRSYVQCIGDECPICENNKKIFFEHPKDYSKVKGWNPRRERFYVNVLDKTPTKVCTACGAEEKNLNATMCAACSAVLPEPRPLNKVRVLAKGKSLFEDLEVISKTLRTDDGEPVDITHYDWTLIVRGKDMDTVITPSPRWIPGQEAAQVLSEDQEKFDLEGVCIKLTREELLDAFNGASIKDIFAIRRASKEAQKAQPRQDDVLMSDVMASVDEIFKTG